MWLVMFAETTPLTLLVSSMIEFTLGEVVLGLTIWRESKKDRLHQFGFGTLKYCDGVGSREILPVEEILQTIAEESFTASNEEPD